MSINTDSVPATNANAKGVEPWKLALAIGLVYPYGLYLLWNHPTLSSNKWWWRCAIAWPIVFSLMSAPFKNKKEPSPVSETVDGGDLNAKASPFGEDYDQGFIEGRVIAEGASEDPTQILRMKYNNCRTWRDEALDRTLRGAPDSHARHAQGRLDGFVKTIGSRVKELQ